MKTDSPTKFRSLLSGTSQCLPESYLKDNPWDNNALKSFVRALCGATGEAKETRIPLWQRMKEPQRLMPTLSLKNG